MLKKIQILFFFFSSFYGVSQTTFYVSLANNDLVFADMQNCTYQTICNTGLSMFDIAITPNETLYSTDGKKVYLIDKSNCSNILITPTPVTDTFVNMGQWINSLVALDDNFLFAASTDALLYKIDVNNGLSWIIDTIKVDVNDSISYWYSSGGDLTWYKNNLYLATAGNELVKIVLDNNYNQIIDIELIGQMNTPFSSIYGTLTIGDANCQEDNLKVLGFENRDIYLVNPETASLQMLCSNLFNDNVYGATSLTETSIQDYTSELEIPNVFTPNNDNYNDFFYPIKMKNISNIDVQIYNRWGNLIFSEKGLTFKWNGINNKGNKCSEGTYYYLIESTNICDEREIKKGFLTLLR